jgi:hypothetical protein
MRSTGRRDRNHAQIVRELRQLGYDVLDLADLGQGKPDLLVCKGPDYALVEIKDPLLSPSKQRLTPDEIKFHTSWKSRIIVATSTEEIIDALH